MGKSSPSTPAPPDPAVTAAAQATANKEAAVAQANMNMINQYTPQGSLEYTQRGTASDGTPQYSATQTYSPDQQQLYELGNQASTKFGQTANTQLDAVSGTLAQPLDYSSLGAAPQVNEQTRQATAQAMYDRMNPQWDRDQAAMQTQMANQGISYGSQAYNAAADDLNRAKNDARLAIQGQAGNEMARMYGLESAARNSNINEMVQQRQIPLNELAAMLSGSQVQGPSFVNAPQSQIAPADIMGSTYANYNGQMNAANMKSQSNNATTAGIASALGSAAMGAGMFF